MVMMFRTLFGMLALVIGITGCAPANKGNVSTFLPVSQVQRDAVWAKIYQQQLARRAGLELFSSSGEFTLRSFEEDSSTWDQVDLRLWWSLPQHMAIRLSTLGTRLALAGWNGVDWWIFDETGDAPRLTVFNSESRDGGRSDLELVSPPLLLALSGIIEFPEQAPLDLGVSTDGEYFFSIPAGVSGRSVGRGITSFVFTLDSSGPTSVRCEDASGHCIMSSVLSRFKPVESRGLPKGAWPDMPFKIEVEVPSGESAKTRITLTLDQPLAGKSVPKRMFDLTVLQDVIKPEEVIDWRNPQ